MEKKTYYTVYKVTNNINGKIYIGCHKTKNLDDGYMGSGKYLKHSIEKNGIDNFTKEIIAVFDTSEEMFALEADLVNEDFLAESNTYNLKVGGFGGFDYINSNIDMSETRKSNYYLGSKKYAEKYKEDIDFRERQICNNPEWQEAGRKALRKKYPEGTFKGKSHTSETKSKISKSSKGRRVGKNNSQFGTRWIHNLELKQSKKIKKDDIIPDGWLLGRKMKF